MHLEHIQNHKRVCRVSKRIDLIIIISIIIIIPFRGIMKIARSRYPYGTSPLSLRAPTINNKRRQICKMIRTPALFLARPISITSLWSMYNICCSLIYRERESYQSCSVPRVESHTSRENRNVHRKKWHSRNQEVTPKIRGKF